MTKKTRARIRHTACIALLASTGSSFLIAQATSKSSLPDAPTDRLISEANMQQVASAMPNAVGQSQSASTNAQSSSQHPRLTRTDAEQMAIKNNPQVSVAHLLALAQHQVVRETRAAELPTATASITAVYAENGSRVSAGSLTASRLFEHAGAGGGFTQLITDFGRTRNLVASSKLQEKAQDAHALATTEDIVLATDEAFYNALEAQALLKVAQQNVDTRQTTESQVSSMTKNKLKSTLDLSFADVNLSQAKLLLLDAQNNAESTMAVLDAVLGLDRQTTYDLVDDNAPLQPPPPDTEQLTQLGLQRRPDLQAASYNQQAAVRFSHAQRDQMFPIISAAGTAGSVPIRPAQYYVTNWWGAIGVNMNIPIFNGFLYTSQAKEASIRAEAASEQSRDLRNQIVRDIRTSWLAANTAYQRVSVTAELLKQANLALTLAQTRYQMGLSSIVELSQAQFQQTDAAIGNTNAQYQYRLALATLNYQIGATP
ncbi:MAG TPA: TolC family protein [Silvibacterium sp.]|nr:TolC family protein [Silvibacterium sp.]